MAVEIKETDPKDPSIYKKHIRPLLDHFDTRTMQGLTKKGVHLLESTPYGLWLFQKLFAFGGERFTDERLSANITGIEFDTRLMVGAGWDKDGEAVLGMWALGAAGTEVGAVLPWEWNGNEEKVWEYNSSGVSLNSLGLPSKGMVKVSRNLEKYRRFKEQNPHVKMPMLANIGVPGNITPDESPVLYGAVVRQLYPFVDGFVKNRCPNLEREGNHATKKVLNAEAKQINEVQDSLGPRKPVFEKLLPDDEEETEDAVFQTVVDHELTGFVISNASPDPEIKALYGWENLRGSISGQDSYYRRKVLRQMASFRIKVEEERKDLVIIGVGGVHNGQTAWENHLAGAVINQTVAGIGSEGPSIFGKTAYETVELMEKHHIRDLDEIVGQGARETLKALQGTQFFLSAARLSL